MENRVTIEVKNDSEHTFVYDGEWFRAGTWKSEQSAKILPKTITVIELESWEVRGVQGVVWWTDAESHQYYLSMVLANPRLQGPSFTCVAGSLPANLKDDFWDAPRRALGETCSPEGAGCTWLCSQTGKNFVVKLTIAEELSRFEPRIASPMTAKAADDNRESSDPASSSTAPPPSTGQARPECTDLAATAEQDDGTLAREQLNKFMAQTRPKDAVDGFQKGFKTAGTGLVAGVGNLVASTVHGASQGTARGFFKGLGLGVAGGVAISLGGAACGVAQVTRGLANTPESIRGRSAQRVWDLEKGEWVDIDLVTLEEEVEGENSDEETEGGSAGSSTKEVADTEYYDLLKLRPNATYNEIKKAYHREARQCHPDKNPGDSEAKVKFQQLAAAYQVLSEPDLRKKYDREGKAAMKEGTMSMDPSLFFSLLFGSERFDPWMGELHLAMQTDQFTKTLNASQAEGAEQGMEQTFQDGEKTAQAIKRRQFRREVRCACHLRNKLDRCVYGRDQQGWEEQMRLEAVDLVNGQFGPELLVTLGEMYQLRANVYLADELVGRYSISKRISSVQHSVAVTRHKVSFYQNAASSLLCVKRVHDAAKKMNSAESEERQPEEEQRQAVEEALDGALPTFLQTAWTAVVTDIDGTVKEVGRKLLKDKSVPWQIRVRRAQAMLRLGEIFMEEGARAGAAQGVSSMSSEAAKATLQEALVESVREKKKGTQPRRREEGRPGSSGEAAGADDHYDG